MIGTEYIWTGKSRSAEEGGWRLPPFICRIVLSSVHMSTDCLGFFSPVYQTHSRRVRVDSPTTVLLVDSCREKFSVFCFHLQRIVFSSLRGKDEKHRLFPIADVLSVSAEMLDSPIWSFIKPSGAFAPWSLFFQKIILVFKKIFFICI